MGLGLAVSRGIGRGIASGVSPATAPTLQDLFSGGEDGALYTPWDLSTMWQDSAGTTPAAVDAVVGRVDDQSGNGNHATQATTAAKPILRQSGSLYYLEFDGVDDVLVAAGVASGYFLTVMFAAKNTASNPVRAFGMGTTGKYAGNFNNAPVWYNPNETSGRTGSAGSWAAGEVSVVSFISDESNVDAYVDGTKSIDGAPTTGIGSNGLRIGASSATRSVNEFYGGLVRSVVSTDAEREQAEAILASKAGVSL